MAFFPRFIPGRPGRQFAFTLIELSVVLAIIGFVAMAGIVMLVSAVDRRQQGETAAKLDRIEQALLDYRRAFGRIPCPADITLALGSANFGVEGATAGTCTGGAPAANFTDGANTVAGMVPVKTLRLPDEYALDGWGNRIVYAADARVTATDAFTTYGITEPVGSIQVNDQTGAARTTTAVYLLLSMAHEAHGAWPRAGGATRLDKDSTNADQLENCDCDADGVATGFNNVFVQKPLAQNPADPLDTFDDLLRYQERKDLRSYSE